MRFPGVADTVCCNDVPVFSQGGRGCTEITYRVRMKGLTRNPWDYRWRRITRDEPHEGSAIACAA